MLAKNGASSSTDSNSITDALAASIFFHTLEESFQVPAYQQALLGSNNATTINTVSEILLDSLPIFVILPLAAFLSKQQQPLPRFSWIHDTLATVAVVHPVLDHVVLTVLHNQIRPGFTTAMLILFPLGMWNYYFGWKDSQYGPSIPGIGLGLVISLFLYVVAKTDIRQMINQIK